MSTNFTRRNFIRTGAAISGTAAGIGHASSARAWAPGPDENLARNLTPGSTPVRLGGYLRQIEGKSPAEMVKQIRDDGFTGAHANPEPWNSMPDSQLRELQAALKEYDVYIFQVGSYTNLIHPDPATRRENLKNLASAIEAADKLFCPSVTTISGSCDPVYYFNVHPDNWTEKTWKLLVESIRQVHRDTAGMKAGICIEAQVTTNIDGPKSHKRLLDDLGDPRCGVNLDPVNMIHLHNYYHTTELINECFDLLGEKILGCHAKDTYIWPDKQTVHVQEVCSGRGVLDYETYMVRMSRMKWPRTIMPEHIPGDQFKEAYAYIRKVADKVGVKFYK